MVSGQWIVVSGQWIVARNYRGDVPAIERGIGWRCARTVVSAWLAMTRRLGMGRRGGMPLLALTRQLEPRTHGGITTATLTLDNPITRHVEVGEVSGGRCRGSPPAQGRAGTARPSERQLSVASCQLPVASCQLPVAGCQLPVAGCRLPVARCPLPVARCLLPVASCRLLVAGCQWSGTAGGGYDSVAAGGRGIWTPMMGCTHSQLNGSWTGRQ